MEVNQASVKIEVDERDENKKFLENQIDDSSDKPGRLLSRFFKKNNQNLTRSNNVEQTNDEQTEERLQWSSFWEYFLSIIGFVIDLGKS
jgi:hypothetical protein